MSTAEQLAEALEAVLAAVRFSNHPPDTVMAAEAKLEAVRKAGEQAREALAAYHSSGGQGVTPLTEEQQEALAWLKSEAEKEDYFGRKNTAKLLDCAADLIERAYRIGTPASTGGEGRG